MHLLDFIFIASQAGDVVCADLHGRESRRKVDRGNPTTVLVDDVPFRGDGHGLCSGGARSVEDAPMVKALDPQVAGPVDDEIAE